MRISDDETLVKVGCVAAERSVSESVLVLVDGGLLGLFQHSAERVDADLAERTSFCGQIVQTVERLTRHRHADLVEDFSQL